MFKHGVVVYSKRLLVGLLVALTFSTTFYMTEAGAHGERNQEPFLRMRTLHWYDIEFKHSDGRVVQDGDEISVNDELVITGMVRFFGRWPRQIPAPDLVYLHVASPGPVFVKKEAWVNGKSAIQSMPAEIGRDYSFKLILGARVPGDYHIHPMINVKDAGGLVGPGINIGITGEWADFKYPVTTLTGTKVENVETYGLGDVATWTIFWAVVAVLWLLWWLRRPLLIPRALMVKAGRYDELVTPMDKKLGLVLIAGIIIVVLMGYNSAVKKYPRTVPLQAGVAEIDPLPQASETVVTESLRATYYLPGRTVKSTIKVTNNTSKSIRLGEFGSANLRFVNHEVSQAVNALPKDYPKDLVPLNGLVLNDNSPIAPGETRELKIDATDALWEVERLSSLMNDPDSSFGALLFFYSDDGTRYLSELYGAIVPTFKD